MITQYRTYREMPSKYLTDELLNGIEVVKVKCDIKPNEKFNLTKIMLEDEQSKNVRYITEGLDRTYPTKKFIEWYFKFVEENLPKELLEITNAELFKCNSTDAIPRIKYVCYKDALNTGIYIDFFKKPITDMSIYNSISFDIPAYRDSNFKDTILKQLIDQSFVFGYNFSNIYEIKTNHPNITCYCILFEAKYPAMQFELNETLYHITYITNLEKIKKHGLTPKSKSFQFEYPDRVHLFNTDDTKLMIDYMLKKIKGTIRKIKGNTNANDFCILKIKKDAILNSSQFKDGNLIFYEDSRFDRYYSLNALAIFTYNTIPSKLIDDHCLIYHLNEHDIHKSTEILKFK